MDYDSESGSIDSSRCSHEWKTEPPWRLVSKGRCQKCKQAKTFFNNPCTEKPVRRSRSRRAARKRDSVDSARVTEEETEAS